MPYLTMRSTNRKTRSLSRRELTAISVIALVAFGLGWAIAAPVVAAIQLVQWVLGL